MDSYPSADAMLADIHQESLQHLLTTVRGETSTPLTTHIGSLDACSSNQDLLSNGLGFYTNRGDVIEIQGPAASGKSHLLYHILVICIIPSRYQSIDIGGWGRAAVLFDNDGTFDINRFRQLLAFRLTRLLNRLDHLTSPHVVAHLDSSSAEDLASQCLQKLHVFRPTSSLQLAATLLHLPPYHASHPTLQSAEIGLVAVDSMSAFYWKDRFILEQQRVAREISGNDKTKLTMDPVSPLQHVLIALQKFRASHGSVTVLTNWGLNPLKKSVHVGEPPSPFYKQHLHPFPSPFEKLHPTTGYPASTFHGTARSHVFEPASSPPTTATETHPTDSRDLKLLNQFLSLTHHITLQPSPLNPLPTHSSVTDADRDEASRPALSKGDKMLGFVRTPGTSITRKFSFSINDEDVVVEVVPDQ